MTTDGSGGSVVPQRAVLVLPSTGEFDSRTFRIASSLVRRGHEVTVVARLAGALPAEERHPEGYRIVRIAADVTDGVPVIGAWRRRRFARRARTSPRAAVAAAPVIGDGAGGGLEGGLDPAAGAAGAPGAIASPPATAAAARDPRLTARLGTLLRAVPRRAFSAVVLRFAIPLMIRARRRAVVPRAPAADIYHGMSYMAIPIALDLARRHGGHAVYDARDIYVDAANLARVNRVYRWLVGRAERRWARAADRVITVNRPYAEVMARRWGVEMPLVVMNCSYRREMADPPERRFHTALALDPATRVVLYHGGLSRDRGIEQLLVAIRDIPGAVLVLMGYGQLETSLRAHEADPASRGRVRVMPAVPPTELLDWVGSADVVAMPIQPTTLNHELTTPNKLFEAMAAGVPVVASDLEGMAPIVRETGCGRLVDPSDPGSIAAAIRSILDLPPAEYAALRRSALEAAHATYNWESQMARLLEEYGRLTGRPW